MDTSNNSIQTKALLNKYLLGKCSPQEEEQVLHWYYSFNSEDDLDLDETQRTRLVQHISKNVLATIGRKQNQRSYFHRLGHPIGIAAALVLIFSSILFYYKLSSNHHNIQQLSYTEQYTLAGQRKIISLADGSKIWLNNASKLKYPNVFTGSTRTVYLEGEAFFEVAHNKHKPFIIYTQKLKVQVLGTSFNVKSFRDENEIAVTVASGKVAVSSFGGGQQALLLPGERAIYNVQEKNLKKERANVAESSAWQNNILAFKYETLENICRELGRWYGVKFMCNNQTLLQKKYTLKQQNESLNNVLKVLSAEDFHYKISGDTVKIW